MTRTALVLAAHGANADEGVNRQVEGFAAKLRAMNLCDKVVCGFHQGTPTFSEVLDRLDADDVVVVPVMTSDGYYSDTVLPRELRNNRRFAEVTIRQTPPLGTHPRLIDVAVRRIHRALHDFDLDAAATAVAVVGHGTPKHPRSRDATLSLAAALENASVCAEVVSAFLDDEPCVEDTAARVTSPNVVVLPFLIAGGPHATDDIPRRIGLRIPASATPPFVDRRDRGTWICEAAIGTDPAIVDIIVDLVRPYLAPSQRNMKGLASCPALRGPHEGFERRDKSNSLLRLGTRASPLALWQADHVSHLLKAMGAEVRMVPLSTSGDRRLDVAIAELSSDSPFTDDIDEALLSERIDLAVHSLKDLPIDLADGLVVAAVLARGDATESLVSRDGLTLDRLPPGSLIGTSSPRRRAQLLALRPDLRPVPLRGPVDDRIRQVQRGDFAAAVLATAGLERLGRLDVITERFSIERFMPAPAQGAMAVTVRENDLRTQGLVKHLDDLRTRHAARAELQLLRPYEPSRDWALAAYATVTERNVLLRGRLLSLEGTRVHDLVVTAAGPDEAARLGLARLAAASACGLGIHQSKATSLLSRER